VPTEGTAPILRDWLVAQRKAKGFSNVRESNFIGALAADGWKIDYSTYASFESGARSIESYKKGAFLRWLADEFYKAPLPDTATPIPASPKSEMDRLIESNLAVSTALRDLIRKLDSIAARLDEGQQDDLPTTVGDQSGQAKAVLRALQSERAGA
jgi:hypothetical protein